MSDPAGAIPIAQRELLYHHRHRGKVLIIVKKKPRFFKFLKAKIKKYDMK
jgi:hypothetical protein